ncbi:MAG: c-type cytochrome [bacterium]|nr:c-type cytochrome [bacterium]
MRRFLVVLAAAAATALAALSVAHAHAASDPYSGGDAASGAKLIQSSGCEGCHGAGFTGGLGPKLIGIEKRLTPAQIAAKIKSPAPPMPNFGFTDKQVADLVAYLSGLDGGTGKPVVKIVPPQPSGEAMVLVTFTGTPPGDAQVQASMKMGTMQHGTGWTPLQKTADPHTLAAKVFFAMAGEWTVQVRYGSGQEIDVPLNVDG